MSRSDFVLSVMALVLAALVLLSQQGDQNSPPRPRQGQIIAGGLRR